MNAGYQSKSISWKYFMFHEMTLKLYFMKYSERKISQHIFPLRTPILKNISESLFMKIFTSGNSQILLSFQTLS